MSDTQPVSGWHSNAVVVPPYKQRLVQRRFALAILDATGNPAPGSLCNLQRKTNHGYHPDQTEYSDDLEHLSGQWLFAGFFQPHFGHQITQCLGRLPWLDLAGKIDGLIFAGQPKAVRQAGRQAHFKELLQQFAPDIPVKIVNQPTRIEALFVGESLFGEVTGCTPHPMFVNWMAKKLRAITPSTDVGKKLYISRSKLHPLLGRVLCEDILEQNLMNAGYEIYFPEQHSLVKQLEAYLGAQTIITTDGSAAHLIAFTQNPDQQVAIIERRSRGKTTFIHNHLIGFQPRSTKPTLHFINCFEREWYANGNGKIRTRAELDFIALKDQLLALQFLDQNGEVKWQLPDTGQINNAKSMGCAPGEELSVLDD